MQLKDVIENIGGQCFKAGYLQAIIDLNRDYNLNIPAKEYEYIASIETFRFKKNVLNNMITSFSDSKDISLLSVWNKCVE